MILGNLYLEQEVSSGVGLEHLLRKLGATSGLFGDNGPYYNDAGSPTADVNMSSSHMSPEESVWKDSKDIEGGHVDDSGDRSQVGV